MRFLVVGPGAMGCLFAARLQVAGNEVTLLDHRENRAANITKQGINVTGVSGTYTAHIPTVTGKVNPGPDFVLICVKSNNTKEAGESVLSCLGPATKIVTLQNGIGNVEILAQIFGNDKVFGGVTAQAATLLEVSRDLVANAIEALDVAKIVRREKLVYPPQQSEGSGASQPLREERAVYDCQDQ